MPRHHSTSSLYLLRHAVEAELSHLRQQHPGGGVATDAIREAIERKLTHVVREASRRVAIGLFRLGSRCVVVIVCCVNHPAPAHWVAAWFVPVGRHQHTA